MAVDTSIQYNSYNSYRFNNGEVLHCYPFGVEGMDYITHSFAAYTPLALASAVRATTTFFDADSEIISSVDHSFDTPQGTFEQRTITVPVPALAVKAQLTYKNSAADPWWVATPKTEEGQTATPYAVNTYGQMTYITPNGIYTGTLTANQIVLASGNETLGDRLTTINSNQISVESRVDGVEPKVTKITSEGIYTGTIQASQITATSLSAISANLGTVNAGTINGVNINGSAFSGGTISLGGTKTFVPLQIESEDSDNYKVSIGPTRIQMYGQDGASLKLFCSTFFDGTVMTLYNEVDSSRNISMSSGTGSVVAKFLQSEGLSLKFESNQYSITRDSNGYLRAL